MPGAAGGVFPLAIGIIRDHFPRERVAGAIGVISALAGAALSALSYLLLAVARGERWEIYLAALLLGAGIGLAFAAMINLIVENVGPEQTGVATGMNTLTRSVGGAFGGAIVASILAGSITRGFPSAAGFTLAFAACAIAVALGVLVGLLIPARAQPVGSTVAAAA